MPFRAGANHGKQYSMTNTGSPVPTISGLKAWYDFSDTATLWQDTGRTSPITADAQTIKGVTDKSGTAVHLSEATNPPTFKSAIQNGLSVGRFDGTNDILAAGAPASTTVVYTMFTVQKLSVLGGATHDFFANGGAADGYGMRANTGNTRCVVHSGVAEKSDNPANTTTWEIWVALHTTGATTFYLNGGTAIALTSAAANPNVPTTGTALGALTGGSNFAGLDFAECILYNSQLSLANVNLVGPYLGSKWGITWSTAV